MTLDEGARAALNSGFLDAADMPKVEIQGPADSERRTVGGATATSFWLGKLDGDGDGKVSREEYITKLRPGVMERGIPVQPGTG